MNLANIKKKAKDMGMNKLGKMSKTDLIHAIQSTEGNNACYAQNKDNSCSQAECCFMDDCHTMAKKMN